MDNRLAKAQSALHFGRLAEVEQVCRTVLKERPASLSARALMVRAKLSKWTAAAAANQIGQLAEASRSPTALRLLSVSCRRQGDLQAAAQWACLAAQKSPNDYDALAWCGACHLEVEEFAAAEAAFRAAVALKPEDPEPENYLGLALMRQGKFGEAVGCFERAASRKPEVWVYRANLTEALLADNDLAEAVASAEQLTLLDPLHPFGYILKAEALIADNQASAAEAAARRAVDLAPNDAGAQATLSSIFMAQGEMACAVAHAQASIDLEPRQGLAYFNLIRSGKASEEKRGLLTQMANLAGEPSLALSQRVLLGFGLGKAHEDLGEYEVAMRWYDHANALDHRSKFGNGEPDEDLNPEAHVNLKRRYGTQLLSGPGLEPLAQPTPIFVFGMMRSGTTLTEQILSSHPDVGGAGEQHFWVKHRSEAFNERGGVQLDRLAELRSRYLEILARKAPGRRFVVDKMPNNYMQAGLLHLVFPDAPMVHLSRNPLDTCLSIYATHNRVAIRWANSKAGIARNYLRYRDLMEHWRAVLPEHRITEVSYEELVAAPERRIRELLHACGLPWSERCLRHEQNAKAVVTPSLWQVRQPIYKSSVERWRRLEPWLGEWKGLL